MLIRVVNEVKTILREKQANLLSFYKFCRLNAKNILRLNLKRINAFKMNVRACMYVCMNMQTCMRLNGLVDHDFNYLNIDIGSLKNYVKICARLVTERE